MQRPTRTTSFLFTLVLFTFVLAVLSTEYSALHAQPLATPAETNPAPKKPDGNRLAYLDGPLDPYYPHPDFPKLITPQWVGEDGVECVVTLAIDDMRDSAKYEAYLRPILDRLKQIDGRAPVSIMSCRADPADPQLQKWLKEGLSIEVHTYDHPCPLLQDGGLTKAKETYDKCVDLLNQIPNNKPVAFRMPCCDSKNTPTPRFWAEIFNKTTEKGNFLQIDSSVFNIITNKDSELPKEITELPSGEERFRRYVPFANFVNTIEDYPYPYIIGGMCWEFPCVTPSDWSAQFVQKPNNPDTLRDWKLALDACVLKQGTFNLVFHPHGWIKPEQIVELIDHAVTKHGKKVKFLTFKECAERLNTNLLPNVTIRNQTGMPSAELIDLTDDGLLDVRLLGRLRAYMLLSRHWDREKRAWNDQWAKPDKPGEKNIYDREKERFEFLFRDVDGDGKVEFVGPASANQKGEGLELEMKGLMLTPSTEPYFEVQGPSSLAKLDSLWSGNNLRLIDINSDGKLDLLFSNHERYCLYLFKDMKEGWATKVFDITRGSVTRGQDDAAAKANKIPVIPPFVRADGTNNGAWFHSSALWLMNEDTHRLPDNVFKLTFAEMLQSSPLAPQGTVQQTNCCGAETPAEPTPNR
jgi:hypothetical protein